MQLERGAEALLRRLLGSAKVVIIEGGRGVGKTTLARKIAEQHNFGTYFDLSDPADRSLLATDPHRLLAASTTPIFVDEAQLEPELTVAVKRLVDAHSVPGQVLLTGSSRIGRGALGGSDPLAGRSVRMRLHAFTQGELDGAPVNLVDRLWRGELPDVVHDDLALEELYERMLRGGLPVVALASGSGDLGGDGDEDLRRRLLTGYVEGVLTSSLTGSRIDRSQLVRTFRYIASNPSQILNLGRAASELSTRAETVRGHIELCKANFLLDVAEALRPAQHRTVTAHPRIFTSDTGLAAWAAATSASRIIRDPTMAGSLLENLVAQELAAQSAWSLGGETSVLHWRNTRRGREVDLVLRRPDGRLIGVEVKLAAAVGPGDIKGLTAFAEEAGDRLERNIVVYTGRAGFQIDERTWAVPLTSFWTDTPEGPDHHRQDIAKQA